MNCAECKELLVAYIEGLLDEAHRCALEEHLKGCRVCRPEEQAVRDLQMRLVKNGRTIGGSNLENRVMDTIIREQNLQLKKAPTETKIFKLRRFLMKSPIVKAAVAAVVVLACLAGLYFWTSTQSGVLLADVLEKVEQAQAFFYRMKMHVKGQMQNAPGSEQDMQCTVLISNEFGMRMDMNMVDVNTGEGMTQQMYMLPQQKMMIMLLPSMKKYMRMEFDESMFEQMRKQGNDPRMMIKQIMGCQYHELGRTVIDGIEVEGFQTTDPAYAGGAMGQVDVKMWVDVKTWLPVRVEMDIKANEQIQVQGMIYDFQWDIPVNASEFTPVIPNDFTAGPGDGVKMPAINETTAIEGLRLLITFVGRYPKYLNLMNLIQEMQEFLMKSQTPESQKFRQDLEQIQSEAERGKKIVDTMMPVQSLGAFYMTLVQEKKEPAYYGESVTPADADKVLLRWKISDSEYRVIYGDLHAETVTPEKLAELEAALPK